MPRPAPTPSPAGDPDFLPWEIAAIATEVDHDLKKWDPAGLLIRDDAFQECCFAWWQERLRYDHSRGANRRTFLNRVVLTTLVGLQRAELADKRSAIHHAVPLDAPLDSDNPAGPSFADVAASAPSREQDNDVELQAERDALTELFDRLQAELSPKDAVLLRQVRAGLTAADLSRGSGLPQTTVRSQIHALEQKMRKEGLREFL